MAQSEVNLAPFESEGIFDIDNAPIIGEYPENLALTTEQLAKDAAALEHYISKRPGHPNYNVGHWIVVQGYTDYGDTVVIVDPAKSDQVSWSSNISAVYTISTQKFTDYINAVGASGYSARGIIW